MQIRIDEIKVSPERGKVAAEDVQELADSIREVGLLTAITVDSEYNLIAGLHRLEAVKLLGEEFIECVVSDLKGLQAELAEIDENIVRRNISVVDYGELLLRRKRIYEELHPETKHGGDRKSQKIKIANCNLDSAKSFVQDTADKTGVNPATISRYLQAAKNMTADAKAILKDSNAEITQQTALQLSRLQPDEQKEAAAKEIARKLQPLVDVGLGYIKLGQSSSTLSGGESQRIKLAYFLSLTEGGPRKENILFIFDEPTTGLHFYDVEKLLKAFDVLISKGHTVIVVEHNLDVIRSADWVIDLGPDAGDRGGEVVFAGTPEDLAAKGNTFTAKYLR